MLDFKFPDVGEGIHEGTIVKWRVKEGDEVKSDQVLVEIETDKAIVEIPAPRSGVIAKTFHKENEVIHVGESLVIVIDKGEVYDSSAPAPAPAINASSTAPAPVPTEKGPGVVGSIDASGTEIAAAPQRSGGVVPVPATQITILPATRVLAQKLGVDITKLQGSGPNGMITDSDVLAQQKAGISPAPSISANIPNAQSKSTLDSARAPKTFSGPITRTPYKGIRKTIGQHMVESHTHTVPVTHFDTVDMTKLIARREQDKPQAEAKNIKLTFLAYFVKAVTDALIELPKFNAELDEATQEIVTKNYYNIGIAVDTPEGLFVPNIKDSDKKDVFTIAQEIVDLAQKARDKKLTPQEISGGTFTITNYGSIGGDFATPVIYYPEVAILGLGKIKDTFVMDPTPVQSGVTPTPVSIKATKTMGLALTFDHRLIDGADAARFVNAVAAKLQLLQK